MTDPHEPFKFKINNPLSRIRHRKPTTRGAWCSQNSLEIGPESLYTDKEREVLALKSLNFKCPILGLTSKLLLEKDEEEETVKDEIQKYSKELTVSKPATSEKSKTENNNSGKIYKSKFC